jgi:cellulose synthase/poly-beta-1,6-N-acetylglucosamine synthase-like glycosyltransferase
MSLGLASLILALLLVPLLLSSADAVNGLRAMRSSGAPGSGAAHGWVEDFEVLVPIYGSVRYLENVPYLRQYGERVVLCTTTGESDAFYAELEAVAAENGFRVFRGHVPRVTGGTRRATGGTVRDRIVRDAAQQVQARFVVCLDADTVTTRPLQELVGELDARELDLCSIRLVPSNRTGVLARLQVHEYRLAMALRRIFPWMVSGACHAARTSAYKRVMMSHSLFFQGNDIELGLLAEGMGYTVGHIPFEVPTSVPDRASSWLRQRLAWAGGEVRLFVANPQIVVRHPFMWLYGGLLVIAATPWRWSAVVHPGWVLASVLLLYAVMAAYLHRAHLDPYILLMPLYAAFTAFVIVPLGLVWYVRMAAADGNLGLIRPDRGLPTGRHLVTAKGRHLSSAPAR